MIKLLKNKEKSFKFLLKQEESNLYGYIEYSYFLMKFRNNKHYIVKLGKQFGIKDNSHYYKEFFSLFILLPTIIILDS